LPRGQLPCATPPCRAAGPSAGSTPRAGGVPESGANAALRANENRRVENRLLPPSGILPAISLPVGNSGSSRRRRPRCSGPSGSFPRPQPGIRDSRQNRYVAGLPRSRETAETNARGGHLRRRSAAAERCLPPLRPFPARTGRAFSLRVRPNSDFPSIHARIMPIPQPCEAATGRRRAGAMPGSSRRDTPGPSPGAGAAPSERRSARVRRLLRDLDRVLGEAACRSRARGLGPEHPPSAEIHARADAVPITSGGPSRPRASAAAHGRSSGVPQRPRASSSQGMAAPVSEWACSVNDAIFHDADIWGRLLQPEQLLDAFAPENESPSAGAAERTSIFSQDREFGGSLLLRAGARPLARVSRGCYPVPALAPSLWVAVRVAAVRDAPVPRGRAVGGDCIPRGRRSPNSAPTLPCEQARIVTSKIDLSRHWEPCRQFHCLPVDNSGSSRRRQPGINIQGKDRYVACRPAAAKGPERMREGVIFVA